MPPANDNEQPDNQELSSNTSEDAESSPSPSDTPQHEEEHSQPAAPAAEDAHEEPDEEAAPEQPAKENEVEPPQEASMSPEPSSSAESIPVTVSSSPDAAPTPVAPSPKDVIAPAVVSAAPQPANVPPAAAAQPIAASGKSYIVTIILSWLLGYLGIDRFYLGKIGTGVLKLVTFGGVGIWYLYDLIITAFNKQTDKNGNLLSDYEEYKIVGYIFIAITIIAFIGRIATS